MNRNTRSWMIGTLKLSSLVLCAGMCASVLAEPPAPPAGPLGGPRVEDRGVPGDRGEFGGVRPRERKERVSGEVPHPVFMKILNETIGEKAEGELKATDEQMAKIKALSKDFDQRVQAYRKEHEKEIRELMAQIGERPAGPLVKAKGKGAGLPPGDKAKPRGDNEGEMMPPPPPGAEGDKPKVDPEQREKILDKVRELREKAPQPTEVRTAIWTQLNDAQKKAIQTKLDAIKEEQLKKYAERETAKRLGKKGDQPADAGARRQQIQERLKNMTPEQREEFLKMIRERRGQKPGAPGAPGSPEAPKAE